MKTFIFLFHILLGFQTFAFSPNEELKSIAREVHLNCTVQMCHSGYELETVYVLGSTILPARSVTALLAAAKSQAQIWGDTILEGDYRTKGDTRLDQIRILKRGTHVLAYRIVYSETARSPEGLGRIVEASWVYTDLQTAIMDEDQPASFQRHLH